MVNTDAYFTNLKFFYQLTIQLEYGLQKLLHGIVDIVIIITLKST